MCAKKKLDIFKKKRHKVLPPNVSFSFGDLIIEASQNFRSFLMHGCFSKSFERLPIFNTKLFLGVDLLPIAVETFCLTTKSLWDMPRYTNPEKNGSF